MQSRHQKQTRDGSLPFEAKTDLLGYQSRHHRLCTDQQTLLVLEPWLSSAARTCAMTRLCVHLLASCCLMQCLPAACNSLDQVQEPWTLPLSLPSEQEEKSLCSGSNCGWAFVASHSSLQIFLDAELRGRISTLLIVAQRKLTIKKKGKKKERERKKWHSCGCLFASFIYFFVVMIWLETGGSFNTLHT